MWGVASLAAHLHGVEARASSCGGPGMAHLIGAIDQPNLRRCEGWWCCMAHLIGAIHQPNLRRCQGWWCCGLQSVLCALHQNASHLCVACSACALLALPLSTPCKVPVPQLLTCALCQGWGNALVLFDGAPIANAVFCNAKHQSQILLFAPWPAVAVLHCCARQLIGLS